MFFKKYFCPKQTNSYHEHKYNRYLWWKLKTFHLGILFFYRTRKIEFLKYIFWPKQYHSPTVVKKKKKSYKKHVYETSIKLPKYKIPKWKNTKIADVIPRKRIPFIPLSSFVFCGLSCLLALSSILWCISSDISHITDIIIPSLRAKKQEFSFFLLSYFSRIFVPLDYTWKRCETSIFRIGHVQKKI